VTGYLSPEDVCRAMAATDLVVAPFYESSGSGSLAMALACGKAIVASNIPPHEEIVFEEPDALLLVKNDPGPLAHAITNLRQSEPDRVRLEGGAERYARNHTYVRMAEETVEVYREVLRSARG
jgi:glycosyltransferase involved in cell wall biosynthesis